MATTYYLWGRLPSMTTPVRIMSGSLAEVRKERVFRVPLASRGGFLDLRIREQGAPYNTCDCTTCTAR